MMMRCITFLNFFCVSSVLASPHPLCQDVPGRALLPFAQPDHIGAFLLLATWMAGKHIFVSNPLSPFKCQCRMCFLVWTIHHYASWKMYLHSVQFRLIVTGKIRSKNIVIQLVSFFCSLYLIFLFDYHVGYLWFFNNFFHSLLKSKKSICSISIASSWLSI